MAFKLLILFCLLFSAIVVLADNSDKPLTAGIDPQPVINMSTTATTPTTKPTDPTTITTTTTTTTKPTDPTTTTTNKPTDPTTTTTTTKPTTTTTTLKPTTTTTTLKPTTPAPPTPPKPTPKPSPVPSDNWVVNGTNGTVCIIANMAIHLNIPYKRSDNKSVSMDFDLTKIGNATATGNCAAAKDEQTLVLTWLNVTSTFTFHQNASTYSLKSVELMIPVNNYTFPNLTTNVSSVTFKHNYSELFSVPLNHSYLCAHFEPVKLTGNDNFNATLTISNAHLEAFGVTNETKYHVAQDCAPGLTPDIVPIVVGIILAGLVVVVLAAYLVGRRRAQGRGYVSM